MAWVNSALQVDSTLDIEFSKVHSEYRVYNEFFGLAELPYRITPDPRFLWYSPQHREVKAKILYHLQARKGPVYLFSDVGLGKTSIARRIKEELANDKSKKVVFAFAPNLKTANAFLRFVMEEFNVKTDKSYARSLKRFEIYLEEQFTAGVSQMLLVDESQNMTPDMLKLIHHLFNFSTRTDFLIQIALFGQNELHDRIHRFASLRSRMVPAQLKPFTPDETREMIAFRWHVAGGDQHPFSDDAIAEIHRLTSGNARDICKLCDAALLGALAGQTREIDKDLVITVASEAFVLESPSHL